MNWKCKIGWHLWGKWMQYPEEFVVRGRIIIVRHDAKIDVRLCSDCDKYQIRRRK